jgi:hypothetical protein
VLLYVKPIGSNRLWVEVLHAARPLRSWLIFDVGQKAIMLIRIGKVFGLLFAVLLTACKEGQDAASNQQVFRGTGIPTAIAVNGLIEINRSDGNVVIPKPFESKIQQDATSLEVQRSFVVALEAPLSFLAPSQTIEVEAHNLIMSHGGTITRRWGGAASSGIAYEGEKYSGSIVINSSKHPQGVLVRMRVREQEK